MSRTVALVAGVVLAVTLTAGGFVAGLSVSREGPSPSAAPTGRGGQLRQGAAGAQPRNAVNGQVLNVGDGTLTIRLGPDQGSRIVLVAPSTRVVKTTETEATLSDVRTGDRVTVIGQENADGTVNAQAIVLGGTNVLQQLFGSPRPSPAR